MKTNKDDAAVFNLSDLSYKQYDARKGAITSFEMEEGKYLYVYEKDQVTKLKTQ